MPFVDPPVVIARSRLIAMSLSRPVPSWAFPVLAIAGGILTSGKAGYSGAEEVSSMTSGLEFAGLGLGRKRPPNSESVRVNTVSWTPALQVYVGLANDSFLLAFNLLGRGEAVLPPELSKLTEPLAKLLKSATEDALGKGEGAAGYEQALKDVRSEHQRLTALNAKMVGNAARLREKKDLAYLDMTAAIAKLQRQLDALGSGKPNATAEIPKYADIETAITEVYDQLAAVALLNADMAGKTKEPSATEETPAKQGGGGGDMSWLTGVVQVIAGAGSAVLPLILDRIYGEKTEESEAEEESERKAEVAPAPSAQPAVPPESPSPPAPTPDPQPKPENAPAR
ncbi:hypothetical protein [Nocardia sp. NPDC051832]|uniref:hypothetical protein n=1 Tax=Nocardia sp. NPDC051832 TaxID=3155673 RepID=UPI0034183794